MRRKKIGYIQAVALIVVSALYMGVKYLPLGGCAAAREELLYVLKAVDGDTLKLSDGRRVRLIGVDTPEVHYSDKLVRDARKSRKDMKQIQLLGRKASDFTRKLCENRKVRLEFDVTKYDRYGRLLAYVYLEDGTFVNAKIIEEGYGQVMTVPPNVKYTDYFLRLERQARENRKGLWAENP
ncbi:MAG: thermonuclease family protein [Candidatus Omnitrophica bacterium]|nr:thermonuclease family protein [Candidatus Omnitrophota bacterium]MCM8790176.1 thermonuclease family protein [Candidatus Omnitrophota bacterium]